MPFAKVSQDFFSRCRIKIPDQPFLLDFVKFLVLSLIFGCLTCLLWRIFLLL
ncbi:MAG TPA: hypothetical protein HPP56_07035 [Nitrospirae bacterium]|nr:hypothetical protein [Nitrospirota bacterium]